MFYAYIATTKQLRKHDIWRVLGLIFKKFKFNFFLRENLSVYLAKRSNAHAALNCKTEREPVLRCMRVTSLGLCLRVIVNEKPLNFEKTTYNALSVLLLIYDQTPLVRGCSFHKLHWSWSVRRNYLSTGCSKKHGNSVTNSISSLLWISIVI